ncbi:MAG: GNAT family N-acetyltransferase [Bacteroidota bacterium]
MDKINIVYREMAPLEVKQVHAGFDELMVDEGLEIESSDRFSFVAVKENTFIGCASGLAYKNGENYSGWFFLTDLFVEKEYRSKGLGAKLLESIERKVKAFGVKHVWLWTSGDKALRFYHRQAYKKFAEMENWYSDGSSRVGLRKNL